VKRLELLKVAAHSLEELVLLGTAAVGARLVDNLEPDSGNDFFVKNLPLGWRSGACRPRDADEQVVAYLQVPA
jgi:hypothetical protein